MFRYSSHEVVFKISLLESSENQFHPNAVHLLTTLIPAYYPFLRAKSAIRSASACTLSCGMAL